MQFPHIGVILKKGKIQFDRFKLTKIILEDKKIDKIRRMQPVKIKMIQDVEPETIQVPGASNYPSIFIGDIQRAVTEKYGIPKEHLKLRKAISDHLKNLPKQVSTQC